MKSRVIELQEKANRLLELAQSMDRRVESAKRFKNQYEGNWKELAERWEHRQHIRESKSRKLWNAYIQVLTEIKLEL